MIFAFTTTHKIYPYAYLSQLLPWALALSSMSRPIELIFIVKVTDHKFYSVHVREVKPKVSLWKAVAQCLYRQHWPEFHPSAPADHPRSSHSGWQGEDPQHSMVKENRSCQSPYACTLKCTCTHTHTHACPGINTTRVQLVFWQLDTSSGHG